MCMIPCATENVLKVSKSTRTGSPSLTAAALAEASSSVKQCKTAANVESVEQDKWNILRPNGNVQHSYTATAQRTAQRTAQLQHSYSTAQHSYSSVQHSYGGKLCGQHQQVSLLSSSTNCAS